MKSRVGKVIHIPEDLESFTNAELDIVVQGFADEQAEESKGQKTDTLDSARSKNSGAQSARLNSDRFVKESWIRKILDDRRACSDTTYAEKRLLLESQVNQFSA